MTAESANRAPGIAFWLRAIFAVVARPRLWPIAARQVVRLARPRAVASTTVPARA